jgi:REP element-mobilizing transposase RayT
MALNHDLPYRRSIRLAEYDYRQPGIYFITVCTKDRELRFGDIVNGRMRLNAAGRTVQSVWQDLPTHYPNLDIDAFIVMPDHFHGIVVIQPSVGAIQESPLPMTQSERRGMTLPKLVGRFKMQTAKIINASATTPGQPLWQRNYWERILRDDRECAAVRRYIRENPQRWQARAEAPA